MNLRNSSATYGPVARALHWWMAALMIALIGLGLYMTEQPDGDPKWALYDLHKSLGAVVLVLAVARAFWRHLSPPPGMPASMTEMEQRAAHAGHLLLYAAMFALPLTGYLDSSLGGYHINVFGLFNVPMLFEKNKELGELAEDAHSLVAYGLMALLLVHAGAALKHHFVARDDVLKRMLGR